MKLNVEFFTIYLGIYCAALVFTIVYPFGSEMVMRMGGADTRDQTGYWVGVITTVLMGGRVISSPLWGYIIDIWGRKVVTQLSLVSMIIFSILFGFSSSLGFAITFRLLLGLFSPLMISSKTLIAELCTGLDVSSAMAYISIFWSLGAISGSAFGGVLSNPYSKGYVTFKIFDDYPYLFPNAFAAFLCFITLVSGQIYIRETLEKKEKNDLVQLNRSLVEITLDPRVKPVIITYFIASFSGTAFQELITLYAWAKSESGGLEFTNDEIGYFLGGCSLCTIPFQRKIYLLLIQKYGSLFVIRKSFIFWAAIAALIPLGSLISNIIIRFSLLIILCVAWNLLSFFCFATSMVLLNNSVPKKELGRINGISMGLNCFANTIAPVFIGSVFAYFIDTSLPLPINCGFGFFVLSCSMGMAIRYSAKIFKENENQYVEVSKEIPLISIS